MTRFTDQSDLYETYVYDILNRLTSKTDRKGVTTTYAYDTVGNLTSETVGSTVTEYTYNANNQ
ncbi:MAG: RHS repeat protein, partial [Clostridia bacterium]|nr:RHS repeat protein [Clostridia bacterium]